jgi:hypothetical protein
VLTLTGKPCPLLIKSITGKLLPLSTAPKAGRAKRVYVEGSNDEDDSDDMHENACVNPKPNGMSYSVIRLPVVNLKGAG